MGTGAASGLDEGLELGGRYQIRSPISSGSMGAVYRAFDRHLGIEVALKRLIDRRHATRFEIEARLLSALQHPRVVRVLDHFQDASGKYLAMELVEGQDLSTILTERGTPGLPIDECVRFTVETCEALQYVHDQQIVHRDVKPQNLICGPRGVVLVDFGIARDLTSDSSGTAGIGTPRYMAPEVFGGGAVSPRSDVFGVAATLWTLIAGRPPVYADPTKLRDLHPDVTPELEETVHAGLEIVPERRVASVGAFAKALGAELRDESGRGLALSIEAAAAPRSLLEEIVKTAAGVFDAAAASIALTDRTTGELVYQAAWGAGAREIVGVRLPSGVGIGGSVVATGDGVAVADCRTDPRFAAQIAAGTGYVPVTMVVVPLQRAGRPIGALTILDRRDGGSYGAEDVPRAQLFADLAVVGLEIDPNAAPSLGDRTEHKPPSAMPPPRPPAPPRPPGPPAPPRPPQAAPPPQPPPPQAAPPSQPPPAPSEPAPASHEPPRQPSQQQAPPPLPPPGRPQPDNERHDHSEDRTEPGDLRR